MTLDAGTKARSSLSSVALLHGALLFLQVAFWGTALGGIAQLEHSCQTTPYNYADAHRVFGLGAPQDGHDFDVCANQYSWYWWVIFFHLIAMVVAAYATMSQSIYHASATNVAVRFYTISVAQWCLFAYDAKYHNTLYTMANPHQLPGWRQGYSAALAGALGVLIGSFVYLIIAPNAPTMYDVNKGLPAGGKSAAAVALAATKVGLPYHGAAADDAGTHGSGTPAGTPRDGPSGMYGTYVPPDYSHGSAPGMAGVPVNGGGLTDPAGDAVAIAPVHAPASAPAYASGAIAGAAKQPSFMRQTMAGVSGLFKGKNAAAPAAAGIPAGEAPGAQPPLQYASDGQGGQPSVAMGMGGQPGPEDDPASGQQAVLGQPGPADDDTVQGSLRSAAAEIGYYGQPTPGAGHGTGYSSSYGGSVGMANPFAGGEGGGGGSAGPGGAGESPYGTQRTTGEDKPTNAAYVTDATLREQYGRPSEPETEPPPVTVFDEANIERAVQFLTHPRIKYEFSAPAKRRFLQESGRGLSPAEVDEALRRAGVA